MTTYAPKDQITYLEGQYGNLCHKRMDNEIMVRTLSAINIAGNLNQEQQNKLGELQKASKILDLQIEKVKEIIQDVEAKKLTIG